MKAVIALSLILLAGCVPVPGSYIQIPRIEGRVQGTIVEAIWITIDERAGPVCGDSAHRADLATDGTFSIGPVQRWGWQETLVPATCAATIQACIRSGTDRTWAKEVFRPCRGFASSYSMDCVWEADGLRCKIVRQ